jgi:hypothetical protein
MDLGEPIRRPCSRARNSVPLRHRIRTLAQAVDVDGQLVPRSQIEVDRLHAFRLLAHAEVEQFVETIASNLVDVTEARFARNGDLTHAGHHLLVTWSVSRSLRGDSAGRAKYPAYASPEAVMSAAAHPEDLNAALEQHRARIGNNHGIKAKNVRNLLLPLGYRESFFVPGLLDQLDELGEARGAVAHSSGVIGIQVWPTGAGEIGAVRRVLPGLEMLERFAPRLLMPI